MCIDIPLFQRWNKIKLPLRFLLLANCWVPTERKTCEQIFSRDNWNFIVYMKLIKITVSYAKLNHFPPEVSMSVNEQRGFPGCGQHLCWLLTKPPWGQMCSERVRSLASRYACLLMYLRPYTLSLWSSGAAIVAASQLFLARGGQSTHL